MADFIQKAIRVRLTFIEDILGSAPANPDIYADYIASKEPGKSKDKMLEEIASIESDPEKEEMKMTIFSKTQDGKPFFWDYQIKGYFKDTCGGLSRVPKTESSKLKAYKKVIDKLIFATPRKIMIDFKGEPTICQRPLRAQTPKGERISLAASEQIPAGAKIEFTIELFDADHEKLIREWLDYGKYSGLSQWRNSGKGRFYWEELDGAGKVIYTNRDPD